MGAREPTAAVQLKFRVREELRARLEEAARQHGLTLNAEITMRLEQSFHIDEVRRQLDIDHERLKDANLREFQYRDRIDQLTDLLIQTMSR